jgi:hypothetical protein
MFNTCSRGPTHRSLTDSGGGFHLKGEEDGVSPRRGGDGKATELAQGCSVSQRQTADCDQQRPGSVPEARRERGEGTAPVNLKGWGAWGRAHWREPW